TLLIARRFRELGVYSEVWACDDPRLVDPPACLGVVLSGGPASVSVEASPRVTEALLSTSRPLLGICYGMQLLVEHNGGEVRPSEHREYGHTEITLAPVDGRHSRLLEDLPGKGTVWMSHGDAVTRMPPDFAVFA